VYFQVSGVEVNPFVPPLVAFMISFFTSMGGVSGAFLLLPYQFSVLGYTAPSVSATNLFFNVVGTPGGILRYVRERQMLWPLALSLIIGTLPGVFLGAWARIELLPDPRNFKFFAGFILCYLGLRLLIDARRNEITRVKNSVRGVGQVQHSIGRISFEFGSEHFHFSAYGVVAMSLLVGFLGGVYGIGGGALIAPVLIVFLRLPVQIVAGPALLSTFATSAVGVLFYQILASSYEGTSVAPDYRLGLLFGLGGLVGMYLGGGCQKHVSSRAIKLILCVCVLFVGSKYIWDFWR